MQVKKSSLVLLALTAALMTFSTSPVVVFAQSPGSNAVDSPSADPSVPPATTQPTVPVVTTAAPSPTTTQPPPPVTTDHPVTTQPPQPPATTTADGGKGTTNTRTRVSSTGSLPSSSSVSGTIPPLPSTTKESDGPSSGSSLATAGIVVGSIVVAAAIGIWVFRKWKLSPSREFQSKINGDDYTDYPRSYESDAVFLRNLGDQPETPAPTKSSPYHAGGGLPANSTGSAEDQYYDAGYEQHPAAGAGYGYDHSVVVTIIRLGMTNWVTTKVLVEDRKLEGMVDHKLAVVGMADRKWEEQGMVGRKWEDTVGRKWE
ncbi:hypothetical protein BGZ83_010073, partial [Gryganskiella cystojenkinii]